MIETSRFVSLLADAAVAEAAIPLPCPFELADGRYRLDELIGAGPRSWVYIASDLSLSSTGHDARVVIKVLKDPRSGDEARRARRVEHPNVVRMLDRGETPEGHTFAVIEHISGGDLGHTTEKWTARRAAELVRALARGIEACHSAGIVHCDLKPSNILMAPDGPKLADFELAVLQSAANTSSRGNMAFMAPEQLTDGPEALTPLVDVYALGGILYYLLTGSPPNGDTPEQARAYFQRGVVRDMPDVDRDLSLIMGRALSLTRNARYQSASSLADDLDRWLEHRPIQWARPSPWRVASLWMRRRPGAAVATGFGIVALLGGAMGWMAWTRAEDRRALQLEADTLRLATKQVEDLKDRVRTSTSMLFATIPDEGQLQPDAAYPFLAWLDWLDAIQLYGEEGTRLYHTERLMLLRGMIEKAEADGLGDQIETWMLRSAALQLELDGGNPSLAASEAADLRKRWSRLVAPNDRLLARLRIFELCALTQLDRSTSATNLAEVRRLLAEAEPPLGEQLEALVGRAFAPPRKRVEPSPDTGRRTDPP